MFKEDKESVEFLNDDTVKQKFANAKKLSDVKVADYDAIFYVGGHGPVLDLASDPVNGELVSDVRMESPICSDVTTYALVFLLVLELEQDRIRCLPRPCVCREELCV
jgi:putative intracellular protease/amidase